MTSNEDVDKIRSYSVHHDSGPAGRETQDVAWEVGNALSAWALVEMEVTKIFLLSAHHGHAPLGAVSGFHAIISFKGRLDVISSVLRNSFQNSPQTDEMLAEWAKLFDSLKRLNSRRNQIAYGLVGRFVGHNQFDDHVSYWIPFADYAKLAFSDASIETRPTKSKDLQKLTAEEIRKTTKDFAAVIQRVRRYAEQHLAPLALR